MKEERIVRYTDEEIEQKLLGGEDKTDWERLGSMTGEEIEANALSDQDNPPTEAAFWKDAALVMPGEKEKVSIRLDADVLDYFRGKGKGYQSRINAVLKAYVMAKKREAREKKRSS